MATHISNGKEEHQLRTHSVTPHLPPEVLDIIFECVLKLGNHQATFYSACLVSQAFYNTAFRWLHAYPLLDKHNFARFVDTVMPSRLPELVRTLDLGKLVNECSETTMQALLGRMEGNLESFTSPQKSNTAKLFPALGKCSRLRQLDFSHNREVVYLSRFMQLLTQLPELIEVGFPRFFTSRPIAGDPPRKLKSLRTQQTVPDLGRVWRSNPPLITRLSFHNVIPRSFDNTYALISCLSSNLIDLCFAATFYINDSQAGPCDFLLSECHILRRLSVPAALIGPNFGFGTYKHPLEVLEVTAASSYGDKTGWGLLDITNTTRRFLPNLRELRLSEELCSRTKCLQSPFLTEFTSSHGHVKLVTF